MTKWFGHNQLNVHRLAPKGSGGVWVFIKKDLLQENSCNVVDKSFDGILGLLLEHIVSKYKCYSYCCYSCPENILWGRDSTAFYALVNPDLTLVI